MEGVTCVDAFIAQQIAVGAFHTCGMRIDGTVACWGGSGGQGAPETDTFEQILAGRDIPAGCKQTAR